MLKRGSPRAHARWRSMIRTLALAAQLLLSLALLGGSGPALAQADVQAKARPGADGAAERVALASAALCGPDPARPEHLHVAAAAMPVQGLDIRSALTNEVDGAGHLNMVPAGSPVRMMVKRQSAEDVLLRVYAVPEAGDRLQGMRRMGQTAGDNGPEVTAVLEPLGETWALWPDYTIYVVGCTNPSAASGQTAEIAFIARADTGVSEPLMAGTTAAVAVLLLYLGACLMLSRGGAAASGFTLNPVTLTAGADGRASISRLQILFFTMIIAGMLMYVLLRIGVLGDLSSDVLTLLGIAGVGAVAANQAAVGRRRLSGSNWAWLKRQGWTPDTREPSASDLVMEQGEFDIYRFQTLVFSLVVGMSLLFTGLFGLSTFELSPALLGLLGISQTIYVGGKAVGKPQISELNKKIDALRKAARQVVEDGSQGQAGGQVSGGTTPPADPQAGKDADTAAPTADDPTDTALTAELRDVASMVEDVMGGTWKLPNRIAPAELI